MSGLDPAFGIKMMEFKVAEMNATFNKQRGSERSQQLRRLKLTRIFTIHVNLILERPCYVAKHEQRLSASDTL